jgi:hypothetical protein
VNGNLGGAPWNAPGGPGPGPGGAPPPYPRQGMHPGGIPPPGWVPQPPPARRNVLRALTPLGAARLLFTPSRPDRVEDRAVRRLQLLRAGAGLAAVVWLAVSYRLVSSTGELLKERGEQVWLSLNVAGATLPLMVGVFIALAQPPNRRLYLRRSLRPFASLVALFGSALVLSLGLSGRPQLRHWLLHEVRGGSVLAIIGVVWLLSFVVVGIVLCTLHVFRAADVHELLPPLLATVLVWEMALVDLFTGDQAGVPLRLRVVFALGAPITVSAIAVYEIRRLRTHHGITLRTALARG